jgi:putative oxidoreductase
MSNRTLIVAGSLSLVAALAHVAVIIGGPDWYRFFGAGEEMASMAEQGALYPALLTALIAAVLATWGLYAFAAAGLIRRLPLMKTALVIITTIYLLRGLAGLLGVALAGSVDNPYLNELQKEATFIWISSLICLVFGAAYLFGTLRAWPQLVKPARRR